MNTTNSLLVYSFFARQNISYRLVTDLKEMGIRTYLIGNLNSFVSHIKNNNYSYILGLGDYRRGSRLLHIETRFINRYGKKIILENKPEFYPATWQLPLQPKTKHSTIATYGPCNRSAYLAAHSLIIQSKSTQLAFIHIPRDFEYEMTKDVILSWIDFR